MRRVLLLLALLLFAGSPAFAQTSISNLPQASTPVGGEPFPLVQNGVTRKATVASVGFPRDYIDGLILSTPGSSIIFNVAAGVATDSTGLYRITVPSALTKNTGAWVQGVGGCLDTGSIANSTWYHVYAIENVSTGVADALCSTSVSAPTMPSGWIAKRRIGAMLTNGSGQWTSFRQVGDMFYWVAVPADVFGVTPTSGATNTVALSVPPGISVEVFLLPSISYVSGATTVLQVIDMNTTGVVGLIYSLAGLSSSQVRVWTNTARQIQTNLSYGGSVSYTVLTVGYRDPRGKDS